MGGRPAPERSARPQGPICATSLAGVTREVEEEWNQRAAPPLPIRDHAGILIYIKGRI
jgi:hypothetical protein